MEGITETEYVKIIRQGYAGILQAKPGDPLFVGDTVKTGEGVKTKVELSDGTVISAAPRSTLQVAAYTVDKGAGRRSSVLKVMKGTLRFVIGKRFRPPAGAAEASWKDTQVVITTNNSAAQVRATDRFVLVRRIDQLTRNTTITNGIIELAPSQQKGAPSVKFTERDVARDVVSGLPLAVVLERAIDSGMTVDDAVGAAINAGVNPAAVVYTAVQEGYATSKDVQSAIGSGGGALPS